VQKLIFFLLRHSHAPHIQAFPILLKVCLLRTAARDGDARAGIQRCFVYPGPTDSPAYSRLPGTLVIRPSIWRATRANKIRLEAVLFIEMTRPGPQFQLWPLCCSLLRLLRFSCQLAAPYPHRSDTVGSNLPHPYFCVRERNKKDESSVIILGVQRCFSAPLVRVAKKQATIESDLQPC
jgi:hypothetical protein